MPNLSLIIDAAISSFENESASQEERNEALRTLIDVTDDDEYACELFLPNRQHFLLSVLQNVSNASNEQSLLLSVALLHHLCRSDATCKWILQNERNFAQEIINLVILDSKFKSEEVEERASTILGYLAEDNQTAPIIVENINNLQNKFKIAPLRVKASLIWVLSKCNQKLIYSQWANEEGGIDELINALVSSSDIRTLRIVSWTLTILLQDPISRQLLAWKLDFSLLLKLLETHAHDRRIVTNVTQVVIDASSNNRPIRQEIINKSNIFEILIDLQKRYQKDHCYTWAIHTLAVGDENVRIAASRVLDRVIELVTCITQPTETLLWCFKILTKFISLKPVAQEFDKLGGTQLVLKFIQNQQLFTDSHNVNIAQQCLASAVELLMILSLFDEVKNSLTETEDCMIALIHLMQINSVPSIPTNTTKLLKNLLTSPSTCEKFVSLTGAVESLFQIFKSDSDVVIFNSLCVLHKLLMWNDTILELIINSGVMQWLKEVIRGPDNFRLVGISILSIIASKHEEIFVREEFMLLLSEIFRRTKTTEVKINILHCFENFPYAKFVEQSDTSFWLKGGISSLAHLTRHKINFTEILSEKEQVLWSTVYIFLQLCNDLNKSNLMRVSVAANGGVQFATELLKLPSDENNRQSSSISLLTALSKHFTTAMRFTKRDITTLLELVENSPDITHKHRSALMNVIGNIRCFPPNTYMLKKIELLPRALQRISQDLSTYSESTHSLLNAIALFTRSEPKFSHIVLKQMDECEDDLCDVFDRIPEMVVTIQNIFVSAVDMDIEAVACEVLADLANIESNRNTIGSISTIQTMVKCLTRDEASALRVQIASARMIANLCKSDTSVGRTRLVVDLGGFDALLNLLKKPVDSNIFVLQGNVICALCHLCRADTVRNVMSNRDGMNYVITFMEFAINEASCDGGAWMFCREMFSLIWLLLKASINDCNTFIERGGVSIISSLLKDEDDPSLNSKQRALLPVIRAYKQQPVLEEILSIAHKQTVAAFQTLQEVALSSAQYDNIPPPPPSKRHSVVIDKPPPPPASKRHSIAIIDRLPLPPTSKRHSIAIIDRPPPPPASKRHSIAIIDKPPPPPPPKPKDSDQLQSTSHSKGKDVKQLNTKQPPPPPGPKPTQNVPPPPPKHSKDKPLQKSQSLQSIITLPKSLLSRVASSAYIISISQQTQPSSSEDQKYEQIVGGVTLIQYGHKNWQSDSAVNDCNACHRLFSLQTRRHHCRVCGLIFCIKCSAEILLDRRQTARMCAQCYSKFVSSVKQ